MCTLSFRSALSQTRLRLFGRVNLGLGLRVACMAAAVLCAAEQATYAETVVETITGIVLSGTDITGVFIGEKESFYGRNLPYTAVFTFDPSRGVPYYNPPKPCNNGLKNQGANTPVTQVTLIINNKPYVFSPTSASSITSSVYTYHAGSPKLGMSASFDASFDGQTSGTESIGVQLNLNGISGSGCRNWADDLGPYTLNKSLFDSYTTGTGFTIGISSDENGKLTPYKQASGYLSVSTITVTSSP
jgi:hypothetical protein